MSEQVKPTSERSPERHEFQEGMSPSKCAVAMANWLACGQPSDAECHQVAEPHPAAHKWQPTSDYGSAKCQLCPQHRDHAIHEVSTAPQPRPEAARICPLCKHDYAIRRWHGFCQYRATKDVVRDRVCGCRCPAPVEAGLAVVNERDPKTGEVFTVQVPVAPAVAETCQWTEDSDGNWDTSCDNKYIIVEGTPSENGMKFCTYCGLRLEEVRIEL